MTLLEAAKNALDALEMEVISCDSNYQAVLDLRAAIEAEEHKDESLVQVLD